MTPTLGIGVILLCFAAIFALVIFFIQEGRKSSPATGIRSEGGAVQVSTDTRSVVTVRKVGGTTRVEIRPSWYGATEEQGQWEDGIALGPTPAEITATAEPELYHEYMSPKTSATRKYEIIDYVYGIGLTLPLIPGLHEQYLKEQAGKAQEKAPEKDTPYKTLHIDRSVAGAPMESMDPPEAPVRLTPEEPESA